MTTNNDVEYDDKSDADDGSNHFRRERLTPKRFKRKSLVLKSKRIDVISNEMKSHSTSGANNRVDRNNTSVENLKSRYESMIQQNYNQKGAVCAHRVCHANRNGDLQYNIGNSDKSGDQAENELDVQNSHTKMNHSGNFTPTDDKFKVREFNKAQKLIDKSLHDMNLNSGDKFDDTRDRGAHRDNFIFNRVSCFVIAF